MKKWLLIFVLSQATLGFAQLNTTLRGQLGYNIGVTDVWGYADSLGNEYALVGLIDGVSVAQVVGGTPTEVAFIPGVNSGWRDLKTHSHYAYVTADEGDSGLTIIDLSGLPNGVGQTFQLNETFGRAHNLYIDGGYAYISGSNSSRGTDILDLTNPTAPQLVGQWTDHYFHDIIVHGDTLYGSAGGSSMIVALDISDKTNPTLVAQIPFPDGGYAHNAWTTGDGNYLLTTQETTDRSVKMWDITDLENPFITHEYLSSPSRLAHNVHVLGDFAYISHYADGLRILDLSQPDHLVEVGNYDTHPSAGPGFDGNWGAYPFAPSGDIYLSDREFGLFIVSFNGARGTRLSGRVTDSQSSAPLEVEVHVLETGKKVNTDSNGDYKLGFSAGGSYTLEVTKFGYALGSFTVNLTEATDNQEDFTLLELPRGELAGIVRAQSGLAVPGAIIRIMDSPFEEIVAGPDGSFSQADIPEGNYRLMVGYWGYKLGLPETQVVGGQSTDPGIALVEGYVDNFELDLGWQIAGDTTNFRGPWQRLDPADIALGPPFSPGEDATEAPGSMAYYARTLAAELQLISPLFDGTRLNTPGLQFDLYWYPRGENGDTLRIDFTVDNGESWHLLSEYGDSDIATAWTQFQHPLPLASDSMRIRFSSTETGVAGPIGFPLSSTVFLDNVKIYSLDPSSVPDETLESYRLVQNYPNPFNAETRIPFVLLEAGHVEIKIFDLRGNLVTTLTRADRPVGAHAVTWDGLDKNQRPAASGVYFYRMRINGFEESRKMVLLY